MKGDFSRFSHDPEKRYTRVLKQQGRVDLDADWNEQAELKEYHERMRIRDIIGPSGVPVVGGGFQIQLTPPGPGGYFLHSIYFVDKDMGWMTGDKGVILATTNGGKNWTAQASWVDADLRDVYFVDRNIGWVVGSNGTILNTRNGGEIWEAQTSGVLADLQRVQFVDESHGWIVGKSGTILATTDGGKTWESHASRLRCDLYGVYFIDKNTGWAVGNRLEYWNTNYMPGALFRTHDGGKTWVFHPSIDHSVADSSGSIVQSVWFKDANIGWVVLGGSINNYHIAFTTNGGVSWNGQEPTKERMELYDICFVRERGWAVGYCIEQEKHEGVIYKAQIHQNQATWEKQVVTFPALASITFRHVYFIDEKVGWIVGDAQDSSKGIHIPILIKTDNGGQNWQRVDWKSGLIVNDYEISPGRLYVNGFLCENERATTYLTQPDYYPERLETPPSGGGQTRVDLVYLDVWEQLITTVEDPTIREAALGGPDTTTRVKTVWQVKVKENIKFKEESHSGVNGLPEIKDWPPAPDGGLLSTSVLQGQPSDDPCVITAAGGYRGLENYLYRVEIHKAGHLNEATFKWSRDNGSVVVPIKQFISSTSVKVEQSPKDRLRALQIGDWVEVLDNKSELNNEPGIMAWITAVDEIEGVVTLSQDITLISNRDSRGPEFWHPKIRRWDQGRDAILVTSGPIDLEYGIQVQFSGDNFRTGDYWTFTARTATGDVDRLNNDPVQGTEHHYCPLALVFWNSSGSSGLGAVIKDCRPKFAPLARQGVHISKVTACRQLKDQASNLYLEDFPLRNDAMLSVDELKRGLKVICDGIIDPNAVKGKPTVNVIAHLPESYYENQTYYVAGFQLFRLHGAAKVDRSESLISWTPKDGAIKRLSSVLKWDAGSWAIFYPYIHQCILIQLTIKGNFIWSSSDLGLANVPGLYLDGDVFGSWHTNCNNVDVRLPSGDHRRGGDFEMWFWLVNQYPYSEYDTDEGIGCDQLPPHDEDDMSKGIGVDLL